MAQLSQIASSENWKPRFSSMSQKSKIVFEFFPTSPHEFLSYGHVKPLKKIDNIMNKFLNSSVSIYLTLNLSLSIYKDLDFMFGGVKVAVQEHLQKRVVAFWSV